MVRPRGHVQLTKTPPPRPVSPYPLAEPEARLDITLPQDYKTFVAITNGQHVLNILSRDEDVRWQDLDRLEGTNLGLLREYDTPGRDIELS